MSRASADLSCSVTIQRNVIYGAIRCVPSVVLSGDSVEKGTREHDSDPHED